MARVPSNACVLMSDGDEAIDYNSDEQNVARRAAPPAVGRREVKVRHAMKIPHTVAIWSRRKKASNEAKTKDLEFAKEFWTLANVITGFSIVQGLTFATAIGGRDGAVFKRINTDISSFGFAVAFTAAVSVGYLLAIFFCHHTIRNLLEKHDAISEELERAFNTWKWVQWTCVLVISLLSGLCLFGVWRSAQFDALIVEPEQNIKVLPEICGCSEANTGKATGGCRANALNLSPKGLVYGALPP